MNIFDYPYLIFLQQKKIKKLLTYVTHTMLSNLLQVPKHQKDSRDEWKVQKNTYTGDNHYVRVLATKELAVL